MHEHEETPVHPAATPPVRSDPAPEAVAPAPLGADAALNLQRKAGNAAVASLIEEEAAQHDEEPSPVKEVLGSGGGSPLDPSTRTFMESCLGADFGDVRVHTDARASESAKSVQATAYTVGSDVVFQAGTYAPETEPGRRTLAHELTHVIQQKAGPVDGTPAPGGIRLSHPDDPFERLAERTADQVMSGQAGRGRDHAGVQRQAEDEEEVQGLFLQRQAEDEEEAPEQA